MSCGKRARFIKSAPKVNGQRVPTSRVAHVQTNTATHYTLLTTTINHAVILALLRGSFSW